MNVRRHGALLCGSYGHCCERVNRKCQMHTDADVDGQGKGGSRTGVLFSPSPPCGVYPGAPCGLWHLLVLGCFIADNPATRIIFVCCLPTWAGLCKTRGRVCLDTVAVDRTRMRELYVGLQIVYLVSLGKEGASLEATSCWVEHGRWHPLDVYMHACDICCA